LYRLAVSQIVDASQTYQQAQASQSQGVYQEAKSKTDQCRKTLDAAHKAFNDAISSLGSNTQQTDQPGANTTIPAGAQKGFQPSGSPVFNLTITDISTAVSDAIHDLEVCTAGPQGLQVLENLKARLEADYNVLNQLPATQEVLNNLQAAETFIRQGAVEYQSWGRADIMKRGDVDMRKAVVLLHSASDVFNRRTPEIEVQVNRRKTVVITPTPLPMPNPNPIPNPAPQKNQKERVVPLPVKKKASDECQAPSYAAITSWTLNFTPDKNFVPPYRDYRRIFFDQYPSLKGYGIEVHHAIEKQIIDLWPDLFTYDEVYFDIRNLRGICGDTAKNETHRRDIRNDWDSFSTKYLSTNTKPTRMDVIKEARRQDIQYGQLYYPFYNSSKNPTLP
jgi:hypothetical protein